MNARKQTRRYFTTLAVIALLVASLAGLRAQQQSPLRVAAAADLQFALKDIAQQYEHQTGHKVEITFGSSGNFFSQLQNGAPFDAFFSADIEYPNRLQQANLIESEQPAEIRRGPNRDLDATQTQRSIWPVKNGTHCSIHGSEDRDCESRTRALRARRNRSAETRRPLRQSAIEARLRRKHVSSRAIRAVRQRASRNHRALARRIARDEVWPAMGSARRSICSDRTSRRHSEIGAETKKLRAHSSPSFRAMPDSAPWQILASRFQTPHRRPTDSDRFYGSTSTLDSTRRSQCPRSCSQSASHSLTG